MIDNLLKLEVAPVSPTDLTYDEAVLYCFAFEIDGKIGWRVPTYYELSKFRCSKTGISPFNYFCWWMDLGIDNRTDRRRVYPIRDLKDNS